ncbi:regulatory protein RecX [Treponema sp. OMZ 840]|uniref:regulatory protein RecX n=1 Tax=Treponema sp. OMZ 840 TaxID=244313 RepID=UPI003D94DF48
MTVTAVKEISGGCIKITSSEGSSFFIRPDYLEVVRSESICSGTQFDEKESDDIIRAGFICAAERQALFYLNRSEHSRCMLERKLEKKGHDRLAVQKALDRLENQKLLDDFRFAQAWLHNRLIVKAEGPLRLSSELASRGIKRSVIESALADLFQTVKVEDLFEKAFSKLVREGKEGKKLEAALVRKGFDLRYILQYIKNNKKNTE